MNLYQRLIPLTVASSLLLAGCNSDDSATEQQLETSTKKNIILMITDGASDGAWDIASFWQHGELLNDTYPYNALDTRYAMSTYALNGNSAPDTSENCDASTYAEGFGYDPEQAASDKATDATTFTQMQVLAYSDVTGTHELCLNPEQGMGCSVVMYGELPITIYANEVNLTFEAYEYINTNYTDSAASGTAFATGESTYNGAISVDNCGNTLLPITAYAKDHGLATGIVSSVQFSHATPAVFGANNTSRSNTDVIGSDLLNNGHLDLIMGSGHPLFDENGESQEADYSYIEAQSWQSLQQGELVSKTHQKAWTFIDSKDSFEALANQSADEEMLSGPLIGLVQNNATLQQSRTLCSDEDAAVAFACSYVENVPSLATMTTGALNYLSQNDKGLFVMIEGGAVDWAAHANDTARIIEEQVDFNDAVKAAYDWVEENSNWDETLLIVTTDHGNSFVLGASSDQAVYDPVAMTAKEQMPEVKYYSGSHTNELVRFYAKGMDSERFADYVIGKDDNYPNHYRHTGADGSYFQNKHVFNVVKDILDQ
ncbi:alkaline phosphatase [Vibrio hippocampi]|uniref:Alkaline phosphatase n=1 Tax=Vibrio hippocampi TaxID=654686 RepID=A0ABN8DFS0_9VIBR|nr:alkaline phosphatase [Vibrio hippocampi]CAH0525159.1 hypothetical protein VHP8226_00826 [Vibrio hippocampi]